MNKFLTLVSAFVFGTWVQQAMSAEKEMVDASRGSGFSGEVQLTYQVSRNKSEQHSLFGKILWLQQELPNSNGVSAFGQVYHDFEFEEVVAGVAKKFGGFEFGLAGGTARYDNKSHPEIMMYGWYSNEDSSIEASAYIERYFRENDEPWFFKGHIEKSFGKFFAGAYGEKGLGLGPMLGFYPHDSVKMFVMVPVVWQPNEGKMRGMVSVTILF